MARFQAINGKANSNPPYASLTNSPILPISMTCLGSVGSLDKQLALGDEAGADSSSDSSSPLPVLVTSDCEQEEEVDDETWQLQEQFLEEVASEESLASMCGNDFAVVTAQAQPPCGG